MTHICVFRPGYLVLDQQLLCSSLDKTISPTLSLPELLVVLCVVLRHGGLSCWCFCRNAPRCQCKNWGGFDDEDNINHPELVCCCSLFLHGEVDSFLLPSFLFFRVLSIDLYLILCLKCKFTGLTRSHTWRGGSEDARALLGCLACRPSKALTSDWIVCPSGRTGVNREVPGEQEVV